MMSTQKPGTAIPISANGERGGNGRFAAGNKAAAGHNAPHARRVATLRSTLLNSVTEQDIQDIASALIAKAKEGDLRAIREVFDRILGQPDRQAWTVDNAVEAELLSLKAEAGVELQIARDEESKMFRQLQA
jgi:hypothetical protein